MCTPCDAAHTPVIYLTYAKPMLNQTNLQPTRVEFRLPILPRPVANTFVFSEVHQIVGRVIDTRIAEGQEITVIENAGGFHLDCSPWRLRPATVEEYALYKEEAADRKSLIGLVSDHSLSA